MAATLTKTKKNAVPADKQHHENASLLAAIGKAQAVIEFAMDGTILTANDNFLNTVGYSLDEIQGRHHGMFAEDGYKNSAEYRDFWARLNRGENLPGQYRRVGKGGKLIIIQASMFQIAPCTNTLCS